MRDCSYLQSDPGIDSGLTIINVTDVRLETHVSVSGPISLLIPDIFQISHTMTSANTRHYPTLAPPPASASHTSFMILTMIKYAKTDGNMNFISGKSC